MIRSKKLRDSARNEDCTLQIAGVCTYDSSTTILAHFPHESHGTALKATDVSSGYACQACHDAIDNRVMDAISKEDREFYMRRAQIRTLERFVDKGLVRVL